MASRIDNRAHFGSPPRRYAAILPYQSAPDMEPGCSVWEGLVRPLRSRVDVFGLLAPWGILPEAGFSSWAGLMEQETGLTHRQSGREAADRVRTWMLHRAPQYRCIALVSHGPLMDVWTYGVRGTPAAPRVKIIRPPRSVAGVNHPSVRRGLAAVLP